MTNWAIVGGTTVTLPLAPSDIVDANPVTVDEVGIDGGGSTLVSRFTNARKLTLRGSIWVKSATNSTIESTYLAPLRAMKRTQVTITDPDSQFSGNWILSSVDFHRVAEGTEARYTFTMEFMQGSGNIIL
jgi:hypothetical protein